MSHLYLITGRPPLAFAVNITLLPTQALGVAATAVIDKAGGCEILKVLLMAQAVKASVTVTVQFPADKVVGVATLKALLPFVQK